MINLETTFAGLKLKNPLIAGSSGLTNSLKRSGNWRMPVLGLLC